MAKKYYKRFLKYEDEILNHPRILNFMINIYVVITKYNIIIYNTILYVILLCS